MIRTINTEKVLKDTNLMVSFLKRCDKNKLVKRLLEANNGFLLNKISNAYISFCSKKRWIL